VLLAEHAPALRAAGLHRVTVSLRHAATRALRGAHAAQPPRAGARGHRGRAARRLHRHQARHGGDSRRERDELADLIEFGKRVPAEVRFIEYMDVGGATRWSAGQVVSRKEMLDVLARRLRSDRAVVETSSAPADRFRLPDGTVFGIISSTTAPFCAECDRSRLTADGLWYSLPLRDARHRPARPAAGRRLERAAQGADRGRLDARTDRGAEDRLALGERTPLVQIGGLKRDPHLEMHTRGG